MPNILPADLIADGTIPQETMIMIIMLPVIGTILGFARHIIGVKSLGLYTPIILTYAYFQLGLSSGKTGWFEQTWYGLKIGLLLTLLVFITSFIAHLITKKIRLHYFPKIAFVLTAVAISVYILILIANWLEKSTFLNSGFLPIILIATVSEQFVSLLTKKKFGTAFSLGLTTALVSAITFSLVIYKPFQNLLIDYPYLLVLTIVANIVIGKFTGLRLTEYIRFKPILDKEYDQ